MARKLVVDIVGDARSLERAFKRSARSAKTFDRSMTKTGRRSSRLRRYRPARCRARDRLARRGRDRLRLPGRLRRDAEAQKVAAQTNAVLKSTGGRPSVTAKQVEKLAESLMLKSGVDDEVIQSGENVLLTFTNIRNEAGKGNDIFDQATKATLDLSVALGQGHVRARRSRSARR